MRGVAGGGPQPRLARVAQTTTTSAPAAAARAISEPQREVSSFGCATAINHRSPGPTSANGFRRVRGSTAAMR
jgi:hypothetical protein